MSDLARWSLLLEKLRANQCSPEELQELHELAVGDPSRTRIIGQILPWRTSGTLGRRTDPTVEQDLAKVLAAHRHDRDSGRLDADRPVESSATRIGLAQSAQRARAASVFRRYAQASVRVSTWRVASVVVALIGAGVVAAWLGLRHTWTPVVRAYVTARGERDTLRLIDGTQVVLAPGSRLVASIASAGPRQIDLDGEADLTVVHDARRPFVVRTKNAVVRDIGTRFVVRGYAGDPDVRVLVTSGVVALGTVADTRPSTLIPGSLGVVTRTGATTVTAAATDAEDYIGWTEGHLVFHLTPISQVAEDLSRWYDLDIVLADPDLATISMSGTLPANKMDDALDALAVAAGARWERHGRSVVLADIHRATSHRQPLPARNSATANSLRTH
jgi:transmembrane sensor